MRLVALRRDVREGSARADQPAVRALEDLGGIRRVDRDDMLIRVDPVRRVDTPVVEVARIRAPRRVIDRRVVREVAEGAHVGGAGGGAIGIARCVRVEDFAAVGAAVAAADAVRVARLLAVLVRTDDVHRVGHPGRRVDLLVIPALRPAEVVRCEVRIARRLGRQLLPAGVGRGERMGRGIRSGGARRLRGEQGSGRLATVVGPPEVRRERSADAGTVRGAVSQVDPGQSVLHRERDHRAVPPRILEELRSEHLAERGLRRTGVTPPQARVERRGVDDAGVERVESDVGDAERQWTRIRLGAVPDLGERGAAVGRLVESGLVRPGLEPRRPAIADDVRQAANAERGSHEDVVRIARVDDDRIDAAAKEGILARVHARIGAIVDAGITELRPGAAAVGRLVNADSRLATRRAAIALARAEIDGVALRVGRIERERADRVLVDLIRLDLRPVRTSGERVLRPPDAATRNARPDAAAVRCAGAAGGRDEERGHPARRAVRRPGEGCDARLGRIRLRPEQLPFVALGLGITRRGVLLGDLLERRFRPGSDRGRDHGRRIGSLGSEVCLEAPDRPFAGRRIRRVRAAGLCRRAVGVAGGPLGGVLLLCFVLLVPARRRLRRIRSGIGGVLRSAGRSARREDLRHHYDRDDRDDQSRERAECPSCHLLGSPIVLRAWHPSPPNPDASAHPGIGR